MAPANRDFVLVDRGLWEWFHGQWRQIDREWRGSAMTEETLGVHPAIAAARADLRRQVTDLASQFPGSWLVPI